MPKTTIQHRVESDKEEDIENKDGNFEIEEENVKNKRMSKMKKKRKSSIKKKK